MGTRMWWVAGLVSVVVVIVVVAGVAIIAANATPPDPAGEGLLYLERATGKTFRVVKTERDSKLHEGFPNQWEVTYSRTDAAGQDVGKPFRVTINHDKGIAVRDGGHSWGLDYCQGEATAFQQAAAAVVDRPISTVHLYPRIDFDTREAIAAWGPFGSDTERAFEVDLVVFGSAKADGSAITQMLVAWLPRWASARKVRLQVAFCGDRRDKVDEPYKGTGYAWLHNTDTLWTLELLGTDIGGATVDSIRAAMTVRHPAKEVDKQNPEESK